MIRSIYVTGTDTGIGKTVTSCVLLHALNAHGTAVGMKPVASGCVRSAAGWRNDDAEALQAASHGAPGYPLVNPFPLPEPTAPEFAARRVGVEISLDVIERAYRALTAASAFGVVEGVGGWLAPLSSSLMQRDLVERLRLPVVLVVGIRLGCINHSLLTARVLHDDGVDVLGWIGNRIDPDMSFVDETIANLRERLPFGCLGVLPFGTAADPAAAAGLLEPAAAALRASARSNRA